jgi:predicted phage tail protein
MSSTNLENDSPISFSVKLTSKKDRLGQNSYLAWVEEAKKRLKPKYGKMGSVTETNTPYEVELGPLPPAAQMVGLSAAEKKELLFHRLRMLVADQNQHEKAKPKMFQDILNSLEKDSLMLVRAHDHYGSDYTVSEAVPAVLNDGEEVEPAVPADVRRGISVSEDPYELWRVIRETHFTKHNNADDAVDALLRQRDAFAALMQGSDEAIAVFKDRFDVQVRLLAATGDAPMPQPVLTRLFLNKLDRTRHATMVSRLDNNRKLGMLYPQTVAAAYDLAREWKSETSVAVVNSGEHMFLTADEVRPAKKAAKSTAAKPTAAKAPTASPAKASPATAGSNGAPAGRVPISEKNCYNCGKKGHLKRNCPALVLAAFVGEDDPEDDDEPAELNLVCIQRSDGEPAIQVDTCAAPTPETALHFSATELLFDSGAARSLFSNRSLLSDVRESAAPWRVNGIDKDGDAIRVTKEGRFADLGSVYYSARSAGNILSQATMKDAGCTTRYDDHSDEYTVTGTAGRVWKFVRPQLPDGRQSRYYTCDLGEPEAVLQSSVTTVADNQRRYTKREVKRATAAVELMVRLGHASFETTIEMLNRGGLLNCPITAHDVRVAQAMFGRSLASIKGKTRRYAAAEVKQVLAPRVTQQQQVLHVDLFFVKHLVFMLGVLTPLGLRMCYHLTDKGVDCVAEGLRLCVSAAASRDFDILEVRTDGEGAIGALASELHEKGLELKVASPGQHVPVVERHIKTIKERVRGYDNTLPYVMTCALLVYCVLFVVQRLNWEPSRSSMDKVSPFEQFSGRKLDMRTDVRVGFGEYVQATVPVTDNSMSGRTQGCITLLPVGNGTGAVEMLSLATRKPIVRDQFTVLPMPDIVVSTITRAAERQGYSRGFDPALPAPGSSASALDTVDAEAEEEDDAPQPHGLPTMMPIDGRVAEMQPVVASPTWSAGVDATLHQPQQHTAHATHAAASHITSSGHALDATTAAGNAVAPGVQQPPPAQQTQPEDDTDYAAAVASVGRRWSLRVAGGPVLCTIDPAANATRTETRRQLHLREGWHDECYALKMSVRAAMRERGAEAAPVIAAELQQMLDKGVWHGVKASELTPKQKSAIIRSSMFLKDKYLPDGQFEKFKARLVAGGDQQDKQLYEKLSSPTAATSSVMIVAAIAAHEGRSVITIDIGGAFLNASIASTGVKVHVRLDKIMTAMLVKLDPSTNSM